MQSAATSVDLDLVPWSYLALGLCWAVATAAIGMAAFMLRTRSRRTNTSIDRAAYDDAVKLTHPITPPVGR
jgi:hypothetical protein